MTWSETPKTGFLATRPIFIFDYKSFPPKFTPNMYVNNTVNSEIFAMFLFSQNFAHAKFCENKPLQNGEIILSFTDKGKS